ncbi:Putative short-chain dehydrogenase/reductase SDR, NAD(P)-binding domain superfamily [Septoria linicola]|uniref:Short-chain dehydrogenase/reductase SDR, NAD(P)-binding domain superfamily n=1 Tax=Septoria linicola TaxID=215465 RepID=A0A9Q9EMW4_9PEZI|nr:putative short-chain dehydrogenase/reductase SDR, NAD(P)-binding domain superfamily [Septoria linicola]USW57181.1 Putative short-chain dehydrogenase/reductase SDR, NAD(P)-binding domain superfamily [Septoria linicola]
MTGTSNDDLFKVNGLVAVITGGGSGLGRMMARALADQGARKVFVVGRRLDKLQETAFGFENIIPLTGDVTDKESLKAIADQVKADMGYINVLAVNSGVAGPSIQSLQQNPTIAQVQEHLWSYDSDAINNVFAVNNTGAFFTMVAFLELLDAGNKAGNREGIQSQVIFTASLAGLTRALTTGAAYIPSKAAIVQLTKLFSTFLAKYQIRVNAVAPGIYPSEMTEGVTDRPGFNVGTIPAGRFGTEEDMRGNILFLTSRAGAYLNGFVLLSDGGRLGQMPATY